MEFKHTSEQARALVAKALRSGKYEQGSGAREKAGETFCCLGVACVMYLEVEDSDEGVARQQPLGVGNILYGDSWAYLPPKVREWLGFRTAEGGFGVKIEVEWEGEPERTSRGLADMNDSGATFEQIASVFDAPPESMLDLTKGHA